MALICSDELTCECVTCWSASGTKRFLLSPPSAARNAALFPRVHACHRHSVLDTIGWPNPPETRTVADPASAAEQMEVLEAVLQPGDVLYIPPWWLCVPVQNQFSTNFIARCCWLN